MVSSLTSGVSGIQQFQNKLDVIGNNIANSDTYGFKSGRTDFEDSFSQSMQSTGGGGIVQVGSGVGTSSVASNFTQGQTTKTGIVSDLAVQGDGYFVVRNAASGDTYATRAGNFHLDADRYLVTPDGLRVQGYTDAGAGTVGDIQINDTGKPDGETSSLASWKVDPDGKVQVTLGDSTSFTRAQVLLQRFQDPTALKKEGNNLYSGMSDAGPLAAPGIPNTNGLGKVLGGQLESSNVDLAGEMTNLISTQRAFQANARIITTTDEMLQEVVNLKH